MQSTARTVDAYLNSLPEDRRDLLTAIRNDCILARLPDGYEEVMNWGMITYQVPLAVCPNTYNGKPLMYAALASQKNHLAIYLCGIYCFPSLKHELVEQFKFAGKKLDMGASCIRFRKLEDLPIAVIGEVIATVDVSAFVKISQEAHRSC